MSFQPDNARTVPGYGDLIAPEDIFVRDWTCLSAELQHPAQERKGERIERGQAPSEQLPLEVASRTHPETLAQSPAGRCPTCGSLLPEP